MAILTESFDLDGLRSWIRETLGGTVWRLEGMNDANSQALDSSISMAIMMYSKECPRLAWENIAPGSTAHEIKATPVYGVIRVDFIEPYNSYGMGATGLGLTQNLTGVVTPPILSAGGAGAGDIFQFQTWRKSFQRVTSRRPNWAYDDVENVIHIYNPVNYYACAILTRPREFKHIRLQHKTWVARMALAQAKVRLGEIRSKFEVQGPGGESIKLNGASLKDEGNKEIEALTKELEGIRPRAIPFWD
jgi:hypothetical protein